MLSGFPRSTKLLGERDVGREVFLLELFIRPTWRQTPCCLVERIATSKNLTKVALSDQLDVFLELKALGQPPVAPEERLGVELHAPNLITPTWSTWGHHWPPRAPERLP